ncbi:aspartyl beta-hydroxylase [Altererythrobacter aestiaquae]|uniref:Aspartyl beta-hydroxylase n=1 Tax=Pontixanthobacter aestiaquae TaxID=1509367 RepID=A0A844ZBA0_9SPHN|nr:aspartyl/asparaginyl beta-hydroxylase domain-containing protein [Pontixanthobacter aestiaquae]MXO84170.1 aspartyl beta-hydroxylase [Pontixanthobacter aestiaquae]
MTTWGEEDARKENDFEVFDHTQHVVFRFIRGNRDPEDSYANPAWDIWEPVLMPVMQAAILPYAFRKPRFPKAMLAKLSAGHAIDPHYDGAGSNQRVHKIHVPLVTNPDAIFLVDGESFHLEAGNAYEVNNIVSHGAANSGSEDRIHFIFEVFESDYESAIRESATADV